MWDCGRNAGKLGQSLPELGISKEGDSYLRKLLVQGAHHALGPFGADCLWQCPDAERLKGKRDRALLAVLLACGLRRHEAVELNFSHLQQREQHWAIVDLIGKAGHMRTVPMPDWVKAVLDVWLKDAGITSGRLFRCVNRAGRLGGERILRRSSGTSFVSAPRKPPSKSWRRTT
jgi:integrase